MYSLPVPEVRSPQSGCQQARAPSERSGGRSFLAFPSLPEAAGGPQCSLKMRHYRLVSAGWRSITLCVLCLWVSPPLLVMAPAMLDLGLSLVQLIWYISKNHLSKYSHIHEFWVDINFGGHYFSLVQRPRFTLDRMPQKLIPEVNSLQFRWGGRGREWIWVLTDLLGPWSPEGAPTEISWMRVREADGASAPGFSWAWIESAPVRALQKDARTSTRKCFHLLWKQSAAFKASQEDRINNNHRLFFRAFGKEGARGFNVLDGFF